MNVYDPCIANMSTKSGHWLTILWHVDDLKLSCKNGWEITKLLLYLKRLYGNEITVYREQKFQYLGMDLNFLEAGVFSITMIPFIGKIFEEFPDAITKSTPCLHNKNLFKIREEGEASYFPEEQVIHFHHTVAQLIFLQKRAQRDIQTTSSFLTSRVKKPDENDRGKLRRVMQYLKGTRTLKLWLTVDNMEESRWLVNASLNMHSGL